MTRIPALSSKRVVQVLVKMGFCPLWQRGSHVFLKHPDGRATVVPVHHGEDIGRGLLRKILRDIETTPAEFVTFLSR